MKRKISKLISSRKSNKVQIDTGTMIDIHVNFEDLPSMFPYSERGGGIYSLQICGKSIFEHIVNSIQHSFPNARLLFELTPPSLRDNREVMRCARAFSKSSKKKSSNEYVVEGNVYLLSPSTVLPLHRPWHILTVMSEIVSRNNVVHHSKIEIEEYVEIKGNVHIGEGSKICRGAILSGDIYIGPNCLIGFNSILRGPCVIEEGCQIGYSAEIKNALIQKRTLIGPLCYVGDTVIGSGCSLGAMTRTSNFRLDSKAVNVLAKRSLIKTGLAKLGCFMGDDVQTGVGVVILPGKQIGNNVRIQPNLVIENNLESNRHYFIEQKIRSVKRPPAKNEWI